MRKLSLFGIILLISCNYQHVEKQNYIIPTFVISIENEQDFQFIAYDSKSDSLFVKNGSKNSRKVVGFKVGNHLKKSIFKMIDYHLNSTYLIGVKQKNQRKKKSFNVKMRIGENYGSQLEIKILHAYCYKDVSFQLDSLIQFLKKDKILDSNW